MKGTNDRSPWTHALCDECYKELERGRTPIKLREVSKDLCCNCGERQNSGILYRADPNTLMCDGEHV